MSDFKTPEVIEAELVDDDESIESTEIDEVDCEQLFNALCDDLDSELIDFAEGVF